MDYELNSNKQVRENLVKHLSDLCSKIEQFVSAAADDHDFGLSKESKSNVLAFLALQKFLYPELNASLIREGLSSLKDINPHVLFSLKRMLHHLSDTPKPAIEGCIHAEAAKAIKHKRSKKLIAEANYEDSPAIMVTLDRYMLEIPGIFPELIRAGMKVARINCAHDNIEVWKQLAEQIKAAENEVYTDMDLPKKRCKIYMDLAGPKIRIAAYKNESVPLLINVKKGEDNSAIGYCVTGSQPISELSGFTLHVADRKSFIGIRQNDSVIFTDLRGKQRKFTVVQVVNNTCLQVKLNKTSLIGRQTVLRWKNEYMYLSNFEQRPVTIEVKQGDILRLYRTSEYLGRPKSASGPASLGITLPKALHNVKIGDRVFFDDGRIGAIVIQINGDYIAIKITFTQNEYVKLKSGKGINLPDSLVYLNTPALTEYDLKTLPQICELADIIGLSFVHHPNDLKKLKSYLNVLTNREIGIVAKIETRDAINHLTKIVLEGLNYEGFGIMIARGDLAVEIGHDKLAVTQEGILDICEAGHIPVIWATGVLETMAKKGVPVKSELTDVFMGLRADCIMLNKGPHIVEAVKLIQQINEIKQEDFFGVRNTVSSYVQYGF
ncbi:pyruvate kinase [Peribacillus sp. SCS-37]|uniref:pyruvate kinase n=1 Tax=Paraperibacillus esterisolvens TaxID=3115296 RepID=UPI003905CAD1